MGEIDHESAGTVHRLQRRVNKEPHEQWADCDAPFYEAGPLLAAAAAIRSRHPGVSFRVKRTTIEYLDLDALREETWSS